MDQVEDEYYLSRENLGRKPAGSTDCAGSSTTELDKSLCPATCGKTKDIKQFCKETLKIDLEVSQSP